MTERMLDSCVPPLPQLWLCLQTQPRKAKKSRQNNALCLFPTRVQRILLYQPEQINKVCGTERFPGVLAQGRGVRLKSQPSTSAPSAPKRECLPARGPWALGAAL